MSGCSHANRHKGRNGMYGINAGVFIARIFRIAPGVSGVCSNAFALAMPASQRVRFSRSGSVG